ncbi:MAG: hypothetical protein JXL80_09840 [Planctomycetes bacterium]|nr:hypothetical protein [Planctomycetota bacterium]
MNALGLFRSKTGEILRHTRVVIKSDRGLEIGTVLCKGSPQLAYEGKPLRRMGTIRRVATHDDLMEEKHLLQAETRARKFCEQHIRDRGLPMQLVAVEHLFGGDRIIFYFLAEGRVDFRDLVKDLAHEFQTRIEMRQIGVRDEARLLADYERCGQFICCRAFIKEFQPISMKMAKVQKATLDPSKISGRCGRLMCCLRYENETYNELKKSLPRKNSYVQTEMGPGKVLGGDILTQLVKVSIAGKTQIVPVDALIARDLSEEQYQAALSAKPVRIGGPGRDGGRRPDGGDSGQRRRPDRSSGGREDRRPARSESAAVQPQQAAASSSDEGESEPAFSEAGTAGQDQPSKRKRRGRRRRKPRGDRPASTGDSGSEGGKKDRDLGVPRAVLEDFGIVSGGDRGSQRSKGSDRGKGSQGNGPREGGAQKDRQGGGKEDQPRSRRRRGRRSHRRGRGGSGGEGNKGGSPGADGASQ